MRRKLTLFFALLCASMMTWAADTQQFVAANYATLNSWFAIPQWQQETSSTASFNDGVITVNINATKGAQWHAQVWLILDFDYSADKYYQYFVIF